MQWQNLLSKASIRANDWTIANEDSFAPKHNHFAVAICYDTLSLTATYLLIHLPKNGNAFLENGDQHMAAKEACRVFDHKYSENGGTTIILSQSEIDSTWFQMAKLFIEQGHVQEGDDRFFIIEKQSLLSFN